MSIISGKICFSLLLLFLLMLGAVGIFFGFAQDVFKNISTLTVHLEDCYNGEENKRTRCYDGVFLDELSEDKGYIAVIKDFNQAMEESDSVRYDCHQVAHAIGRQALRVYGDVGALFNIDRGLDTCAGGFFHGVVEGLFREGSDGAEHIGLLEMRIKTPELCDQFDKHKQKEQCAHGIGHGAMALIGVPDDALAICEAINDTLLHSSCYSGVFMEYHISGQSFEDNPKNSNFPCNAYPYAKKAACYYVHSFRLVGLGMDGDEIAAACRTAPMLSGDLCLRGYSIFFLAHDVFAGNARKIERFCATLPRGEARICAEGVAARLTAITEDTSISLPFCRRFKDDFVAIGCRGHARQVDHD